jgi:hypothetical protein
MAHQAPAGRSTPANIGRPSTQGSGNGAEAPGRAPEALQHPLTLTFLFLAGLALIHLMGISPLPVSPLWGAILLPAAATAAVGSFYWAYTRRRKHPGSGKAEGDDLSGAAVDDLEALRDSLEQEFAALDSHAGLKALADLRHEYQQMQATLGAYEGPASLSSNYIPRLVDETYRQGLRVLFSALGLARTIQAGNRDKLEEEIAELESEMAALRRDQASIQQLGYREETVKSHRERLALLDRQQLRVDELLYQSEMCEASLARAHLALAALHANDAESSVGAVTETLESTIDRAKAVQEELRQLGF